jgi:hypothetical protein
VSVCGRVSVGELKDDVLAQMLGDDQGERESPLDLTASCKHKAQA